MAWNGAGTFSRLYSWVTDAANGVDIDATRMDADTDDITSGLNNAICKDGQNTPTANLPMGGYKHTGVSDGTARAHYASVGQVQDGSATYCVAGGTADALTLAFSPVVTALVDGQRFRFKASATNTGAATAAVNGIAAKAVKRRDGGALAAGDIASGLIYDIQYVQSSDAMVLVNALPTPTDIGAIGQGKHTISIPAGAMIARTTNGAASGSTETTTNKVMLRSMDFDTATQEHAQFTVPMPKSWNEGTLTFQAGWTAASGSGGVAWALQAVAVSDDDALDVAYGTAQTVTDTLITANDLHIAAESSAITVAGTPAAGDAVLFQIYRDVANGSDTLGVDAKLLWVRVYLTIDAATDA